MKTKVIILLLLPLALIISACGGTNEEDDDDDFNTLSNSPTSSNNSNLTLTTPSAGRLLASQCAQCHGTAGISTSRIESLAGEVGEIREELREMQFSNRNRIMHLQAKGYTQEEVSLIANYYSGLYGGGQGNDDDHDDDDDRFDDDDDDRFKNRRQK